MKKSYQAAWCIGAILAAAAPKAAAVTTVVTNDAFDLAAAFAPTPGDAIVTGNFVEFSGASQLGSFIDGGSSIGFGSGIILSTGDVTEIGIGAGPALSTAFGGSPLGLSTTSLLDQIPGFSSPYGDTVRLNFTIDPGLVSNFVNFSFAYLTSEISPSDKFGIFVDGVYTAFLAGFAIDQGHPWMNASAPDLGLNQTLYENGNTLNPLYFTMSLAVPSAGSAFDLDFLLTDVFGDAIDTAVFLGDFSVSEFAEGSIVVVPEPSSAVALGVIGVFALTMRRRKA